MPSARVSPWDASQAGRLHGGASSGRCKACQPVGASLAPARLAPVVSGVAVDDMLGAGSCRAELNEKNGWNVSIHVDGASGAFVAPFLVRCPGSLPLV